MTYIEFTLTLLEEIRMVKVCAFLSPFMVNTNDNNWANVPLKCTKCDVLDEVWQKVTINTSGLAQRGGAAAASSAKRPIKSSYYSVAVVCLFVSIYELPVMDVSPACTLWVTLFFR